MFLPFLGKAMGGRTSTHVANNFDHTVYAMVDAERARVKRVSSQIEANVSAGAEGFTIAKGVSSSASVEYDYNIIKTGFTRILPGKFVRFDVDMWGANTAYISVIYIDGKEMHLIADALPRKEDKSVIINKSGQLVDAVYGTIWTEE